MTSPTPEGLASPSWQPSREWPQMMAHLTESLRALRGRRGAIDVAWQYHDGEHPQVWLNDTLRQVFGGKDNLSELQDNYCGMAVGAYLGRLQVNGWALRKPVADDAPEDVVAAAVAAEANAVAAWDSNDMELEEDDVYRAAFVAGEAPVLVWPRIDPNTRQQTTDEEGRLEWDVVAKDARNVYVKAGPKRRSRLWVWMVWLDVDRWRATGYYSDQDGKPAEVVRLHTTPTAKPSSNFPEQASRFIVDETDPGGPLPEVFGGKCPVVPFKLDRSGRSWLHDAIPVQDKINKLAANKMVTAEFLAFPQRYALTDQVIPEGTLRYSPGKMLKLDPGGGLDEEGKGIAPTSVGEFTAADLETYDKAKNAEVDTLFTIKLLPRHLRINPGTPPSGDAVKADEGPHTSYVRNTCQKLFGAAWSDVQQLMGNDVVPVWESPEVANALAEAQELDYLVRSGVPLLAALRRTGWTPDEIALVGDELDALRIVHERAQEAAVLAQQQGRAEGEVAVDDGLALDKRVNMAGILVRSGWDPVSVESALDLPVGLVHTGALPVTVRTATEVSAEEQAAVEAVDAPITPEQPAPPTTPEA